MLAEEYGCSPDWGHHHKGMCAPALPAAPAAWLPAIAEQASWLVLQLHDLCEQKGLCIQIEKAAEGLWSCIYYILHWLRKVVELVMVLKHAAFSLQVFPARAYLPTPVIKDDLHIKKG